MRYPRVAALLYDTPLAILPSKLAEIRAFLELKFAGGDVPPEEIAAVVGRRRVLLPGAAEVQARVGHGHGHGSTTGTPRIVAGRGDASGGVQRAGRVAVLPVMGTLSQRGGNLEDVSTQCVSCEKIGAQLDTLVADKSCKAIVMLFDSPGGNVFGVGELANKINALAKEKTIAGMIDSVAARAAYWLASQCSELSICPGGQCGSIGVLCVHSDESKAADTAGVKTTLVTSSKFKAEGNPYAPLDAEARAELQRMCDAYHGMFVGAVARGRGVTEGRVNKDFGEGRMLLAKDARAAGMVDSVSTFAAVLNRLGAETGGGARASLPGAGVGLSAEAAAERAAECMAEASRPAPVAYPRYPSSGRWTPSAVRDRMKFIEDDSRGDGDDGN